MIMWKYVGVILWLSIRVCGCDCVGEDGICRWGGLD